MKKQITIDGDGSDWYEKAIFILKENKKADIPDNLFLHAENIIETHLKKNPRRYTEKCVQRESIYKKGNPNVSRRVDLFFNISIFICTMSIIVVIILLFIL